MGSEKYEKWTISIAIKVFIKFTAWDISLKWFKKINVLKIKPYVTPHGIIPQSENWLFISVKNICSKWYD